MGNHFFVKRGGQCNFTPAPDKTRNLHYSAFSENFPINSTSEYSVHTGEQTNSPGRSRPAEPFLRLLSTGEGGER